MEVSCACDLRELMEDSKKAKKAMQQAFGQLVELAYWAFDRLITLTPKSGHSREGDRVSDSWEMKFQRYALWRELEWSVLSDNEIVGYLEYGTRDHWIYPRVAKMLHWIDPDTGEDCFSAGHMVSGIKPVGMIRQTEAELERKIRAIQGKAKAGISN